MATQSKTQPGVKILFLLATIFPLFFFPLSIDPFYGPKLGLFIVFVTGFFLMWLARTWKTGRVHFALSPLTLATFLIAAVTTLAGFLTVNAASQMTGVVIAWWAIFALQLFGSSVLPNFRWSHLLTGLLLGASLLSVFSLLQISPIPPTRFLTTVWPVQVDQPALFTLSGSLLASLQLMIPVAVAGLVWLWENRKEQKQKALTWSVLLIIVLSGIGMAVFTLLRNPDSLQILPFAYGWGLMIETFKNLRLFLLGVGPENFVLAFQQFRDASYNTTPLWATRFDVSSTQLLHTITTTGIIGFAAWAFMWFLALSRVWKLPKALSLKALLITLLVMYLTMPYTILMWILLGLVLLALQNELQSLPGEFVKQVQVLLFAIKLTPFPSQRSANDAGRPFAWGFGALLALLMAGGLLWSGRVFAAQSAYYFSLQAALQNDGMGTYNWQARAKDLQAQVPVYHQGFANTSLILANALSQKQDRTAEEEQLMVGLVQQAIREGRLAASLDVNRTASWENLSNIYRQLGGIEGAPEWAVAAQIMAIQTDPISPQLRLSLGSLYLQQNATPSAQRLFEQTVQLKPDWAIGYFWYGQSLELQNQLPSALAAYQRSQELLPPETTEADRKVVAAKIAELQEKVQKLQQQQANLQTPSGPSVPEQPNLSEENTPDDFQQVIEGDQGEENQEQTQASPTPAPSDIVLPENVGI